MTSLPGKKYNKYKSRFRQAVNIMQLFPSGFWMLMWIDRAAAMGVGSAAIDCGIMLSNFKNELRWNEMVVLLGREDTDG